MILNAFDARFNDARVRAMRHQANLCMLVCQPCSYVYTSVFCLVVSYIAWFAVEEATLRQAMIISFSIGLSMVSSPVALTLDHSVHWQFGCSSLPRHWSA